MPSATMNSEPRGPISWLRTSGWRLALPVLRSATRKVSSLCSRLRPRSVFPNTDTRTPALVIRPSGERGPSQARLHYGDRRGRRESHGNILPVIRSESHEFDEDTDGSRERQRPLGVSCSARVPCSHVPGSSPRLGDPRPLGGRLCPWSRRPHHPASGRQRRRRCPRFDAASRQPSAGAGGPGAAGLACGLPAQPRPWFRRATPPFSSAPPAPAMRE